MRQTEVMQINAAARGDISLAQAREVGPEALAAARALAHFAAGAGRPDLAVTILEGLVALDPTDDWSLRALGTLHLEHGRVAAAWNAAQRAVSLAQSRGAADPLASLLVARVLVAEGRREEARPWLDGACGPAAPPAVRVRARALRRRIGGA